MLIDNIWQQLCQIYEVVSPNFLFLFFSLTLKSRGKEVFNRYDVAPPSGELSIPRVSGFFDATVDVQEIFVVGHVVG